MTPELFAATLITYYSTNPRLIDVDIALNDDEDVVNWKQQQT